jgi:protein-tyrosine phosphatase
MPSLARWFLPALDCSNVTPQIGLGSAFAPRHVAELRKRGFTAVVDCRQEATDDAGQLKAAGITFLHLPMLDHAAPSVALLAAGVDWVAAHLGRAKGGQVLVHCQAGIGRSPLLVACVLVGQGYPAGQALDMIRASRPRVAPNVQQLEILRRFARDWAADPARARRADAHQLT